MNSMASYKKYSCGCVHKTGIEGFTRADLGKVIRAIC